MPASGNGLSPYDLYPLPAAAPDGPLIRVVAAASRRWQAALPRWRAGNFRAQGRKVAESARALAPGHAGRLAVLRDVRRRLRRDFWDETAQRQALALAGASWGEVKVEGGGELVADALPSALEYAAALAAMRGRLVEVGASPDSERVAMLAAMALAPWGGGVHLVTGEAERATALAGRLERMCAPLAFSVGLVEPGMGPEPRRAAWHADITCTPVSELVTDALRDLKRLADHPGDLRLRLERLHGENSRAGELVQRGLRCAVLLDAGKVLLDDALRTVALSADNAASQELQALALAWDVSAMLDLGPDAGSDAGRDSGRPVIPDGPAARRRAAIALTDAGRGRLAGMLAQRGGPWSSPRWREQRVELALLARHVLKPDVHYDVSEPRIQPLEPAFGELVPDAFERRLVLDLLAIRHEREVQRTGTPVASMSVMECFIRYARIGGTLAAADRLAVRELRELYDLPVLPLAERPAEAVVDSDAPPLSPEERRYMIRARAEHRQVAGRLQKLLAFTGRA